MKMTWQIGRRIYEATHVLKEADKNRPAGMTVYLEASRKEADGSWTCLCTGSILNKESNSYQFVTDWDNLEKIKK